ncbi:divergent polysaccharide deacetylase family protein [Pasteurella skyensis]|uniref:Divergent polysaccharide deacetylase family protein n=2 Tax=Phocoenobacter skyensis TaxID=97481 RepID=A0AAJ6N906_9PAST|nr:divergent polysaccharide deacetylase family protein [Pasteurella skyensis]MDP8162468.1 divergent polysaccharide deacetylase family protein [Pasteurella skyensis]MDP8172433.1 divergent polysaccharide deacetylase family protein [Pasteurella skyensis]MDP8177458.1 divergent polysaccharide deacetylase family protein [Pasteurella skyensis]MDP8178688.1 divergent polysaccharide deacetylase family protein [Pasteurella skyensis]MDP8183022.1 divergent polysaccharide deacetylase family protein [Pasteur
MNNNNKYIIKYKRLMAKFVLPILIGSSSMVQAGKLAIVIDDIGYRQNDLAIYNLPKAIAVSIIPSSPYATARAKQAFKQQRDILIHLPMQPLNNASIETGALKIGMSKEKIENLIINAKKLVPYAIGLNNHMGSAATADETVMGYLMDILSKNGLFFLDSLTNGKSVAADIAKSLGVPTLVRNVFLDDSNKLADVQNRFDYAVRYARKKGVAILIAHPRTHSIQVLKQKLRNLPKDIQLVNIGHLWRQEQILTEKPLNLFFNINSQTSQSTSRFVPLLRGVPKE